jgi:sugar phosphate permease
LPLHLFLDSARSAAFGARMLFIGGMVGFWFFTTQYLQGVLLYSPLQAGIAFLPVTIPNFFAALWVPRLSRAAGNARLLASGFVLCIAGLLWIAQAHAQTPYLVAIALPMVLLGIGQGLVLAPLTVAAVQGVASEDAGAASGIVNAAHQLGGSLGLSVLVVVFAWGGSVGVESPSPSQLASHITNTFLASAVMLAMGLAWVLAFIVRPNTKE